jgi:hypothetical protein
VNLKFSFFFSCQMCTNSFSFSCISYTSQEAFHVFKPFKNLLYMGLFEF